MQIPLRASGSSEIFPGTQRRPDQTQSHYWPYGQQGNYWRRREKKERGGIFTTWTHTPHPQGESKLQSALQDRGGSQTGVRLKDEWERKRGAGRKRWQEKCEYVSVDNCGQLCTLLGCVWIPVYHADASFSAKKGLTALKYVLQSICILKKSLKKKKIYICIYIFIFIYMQVHACRKPTGGEGGGLFGLIITCLLEIRKKCFVKRKHGRQSSIPADPGAVALVIGVSLEIPLWPANVIASEQSP